MLRAIRLLVYVGRILTRVPFRGSKYMYNSRWQRDQQGSGARTNPAQIPTYRLEFVSILMR